MSDDTLITKHQIASLRAGTRDSDRFRGLAAWPFSTRQAILSAHQYDHRGSRWAPKRCREIDPNHSIWMAKYGWCERIFKDAERDFSFHVGTCLKPVGQLWCVSRPLCLDACPTLFASWLHPKTRCINLNDCCSCTDRYRLQMRSDEFCFLLLFLLTHKLNIADPINIHEMGKPRAQGAWPPRLYKDAVDTLQQVLEEKRVEQMARHRWWNT